ncbi:MAG: 16S rRNA (uracil(1498)-N(3))-methyltransferase [Methylibium sp.]|nr:16S rRNA (uracil(1498)-N(3))-methyltransferase [Methylibium sp.]
MPRFLIDLPLAEGLEAPLPAAAARHVQVLRLQPGDGLTLFDGSGSEWEAQVLLMGRTEVRVRVGASRAVDRELPLPITLAIGMPANERMDWLVEKATELGVSTLQPLVCERSVLRMSGERADKKLAHWQGVAAAAAEQCGRAALPRLLPVRSFAEWQRKLLPDAAEARFVLSLGQGTLPFAEALPPALRAGRGLLFLSGPEGGLGDTEEAQARAAGLQPITLGPRVLRAETAALTALAAVAALFG